MVYVLDKDGHPLMPTNRHRKVRRMLKSGQAKVVKKCPFIIQLMYESEHNVQSVSLGIDAGSKRIGVSATTKTTVLYEADVELRDDIAKLLATRRQMRSSRRSRKTRYRPKRFDNRQIHKFNTLRKGVRKLNQSDYLVKGYRIFDKVRYQGKEYFIFGRRKKGFFDIRTLSGEKVNNGSLSIKKIAFVDTRKNYITERRTV